MYKGYGPSPPQKEGSIYHDGKPSRGDRGKTGMEREKRTIRIGIETGRSLDLFFDGPGGLLDDGVSTVVVEAAVLFGGRGVAALGAVTFAGGDLDLGHVVGVRLDDVATAAAGLALGCVDELNEKRAQGGQAADNDAEGQFDSLPDHEVHHRVGEVGDVERAGRVCGPKDAGDTRTVELPRCENGAFGMGNGGRKDQK